MNLMIFGLKFQLTIIFVWFLSAVVSAPRYYVASAFEVPLFSDLGQETVMVVCAPVRKLYDTKTGDMINFVLLFLGPLLMMSVLYGKIGTIIWRSSTVFKSAPIDRPEPSVSLVPKHQVVIIDSPQVPPNSVVTNSSSENREERCDEDVDYNGNSEDLYHDPDCEDLDNESATFVHDNCFPLSFLSCSVPCKSLSTGQEDRGGTTLGSDANAHSGVRSKPNENK